MIMKLDFADYNSGGYYISKYVERPSYSSADLLPEKILSLSGCICEFVPDTWTLSWTGDLDEDRQKNAAFFGLTPETFKQVSAWTTAHFDNEVGWPNVCFDLETARLIRDQFIATTEPVVIFGIGLHKTLQNKFCDYAKPPEQKEGFAPVGETGLYRAIRTASVLQEGGKVLGFEPVSFDQSQEHSWLCNELEKEIHRKLGVRPNENGYIDDFETALKCVDHISLDEVGAEPGLWLPWLIVKYD